MSEARPTTDAPHCHPGARPSVEIARELHVPLARSTRLPLESRLTERGQVKLVEEILLVGEVGGSDGHPPDIFRACPFETRIEQLLARLSETEACGFEDLFADVQTRAGMIVTFLALLEMIRLKTVRVFQQGNFGPIRVYKRARPEGAPAFEPA